MNHTRRFLLPSAIGLLAILSFWKLWLIRDVIWDDNCWLLSAYATEGLEAFLNTGFYELRRASLGVFTYLLFGLHRETDYFFPILHGLTFLTLIGSPLLLYLLIRTVAPDRRALALFTALAFVAFYLDHNLGYASMTNYRLGLMLQLASLVFTARAILAETTRLRWLLAAFFSSAIAYYVFLEAAFTLEAARVAVIALAFRHAGLRGSIQAKQTLFRWAPFMVLCLPLIASKLLYKPYGIYEGSYSFDLLRLLNISTNLAELRHVLFSDWLRFWKLWRLADTGSFISGLLAAALCLGLLRRLKLPEKEYRQGSPNPDSSPAATDWRAFFRILLIGFAVLLPPAMLFQATGLGITFLGAQDNAHAILLLPGYALLLGNLLAAFFTLKSGKWHAKLAIACVLGVGVFYNNLALDLFKDSWRAQSRFWQAFMQRFPALPESADFMIDARLPTYYPDLRINFDFEYQLNLLYARSTDPARFRRYRVFTNEDFYRWYLIKQRGAVDMKPIERTTHLGKETLDPVKLIAVRYDGVRLLVNNEIVLDNPKIEYRLWADKNPPRLLDASAYPLRGRYHWPN